MFVIVWEFEVAEASRGTFERVYGRGGDWEILFRRDPAYLGTDLLRDAAGAGRYLTIDRWQSRAAFEAFRSRNDAEYAALDRRCEALTARERLVGRFETP